MPKVLIELDEATAERLEKVAAARSRKRSDFIRQAIRRALWALEEEATAEAYERHPDSDDAHFDPDVWEPPKKSRRGSKR